MCGRASDRHITQLSGFLDHLIHGDLVLADRGFNIHDDLAVCGARLGSSCVYQGKEAIVKGRCQTDKMPCSCEDSCCESHWPDEE